MTDHVASTVLVCDERFEYETGKMFPRSVCRLRLYRRSGWTIALASELADNSGASITNSTAALATALVEGYQLNPEHVVFIEHYDHASYRGSTPETTFDLLRFTWTTGGAIEPHWQRLNESDLESLGLSESQLNSPSATLIHQMLDSPSSTSLLQQRSFRSRS